MSIKAELVLGVYNVYLKGKTVIIEIMEEDKRLHKHYHRYKTAEKAEYMFQIFGKGSNMINLNELEA